MKYSINGIEDSRIVKTTELVNIGENKKALMVNYLDGTQDVFECTEQNLNKIKELMTTQAEAYVKGGDFRIAGIAMAQIFTILGMFVVLVGSIIMGLDVIFISAILECLLTINMARLCIKREDIEKYKLFMENAKDKVESYNKIVAKENQKVKNKSRSQKIITGIMDLDKVSLKDVEGIINKVDRYEAIAGNVLPELETKNQKVKSL